MKNEELKNLFNKKKAEHSKVLQISHISSEMQPYLKPNTMLTEEAKFMFLLRTRMLDVRVNLSNKHKDINCHFLTCCKLTDETSIVRANLIYESIIESNDHKLKKKLLRLKSPNVTHVNLGDVF